MKMELEEKTWTKISLREESINPDEKASIFRRLFLFNFTFNKGLGIGFAIKNDDICNTSNNN